MKKQAVVICNGEMPSAKILSPLLKNKPFILCADGGADKARILGITPDCIIGDLDSISAVTRRKYSRVPQIFLPDQESTDLEKAFEYLLQQGYTAATVIGATGERADHTLSNFSILAKYHGRLSLQFVDDRCTAFVVRKKAVLRTAVGQVLSLVPLGKCTGIVTKGLRYPLTNETLEPGVREGTSNAAVRTTVSISVKRGVLLLFIIHRTDG